MGNLLCKNGLKSGQDLRSTIEASNLIQIRKNVTKGVGVPIIDDNTYPINPEDRKIMRHSPHNSFVRKSQNADNAPIIIS